MVAEPYALGGGKRLIPTQKESAIFVVNVSNWGIPYRIAPGVQKQSAESGMRAFRHDCGGRGKPRIAGPSHGDPES
jgi:hypothetical protein